jgi:hypothetical protein
VQEQWTEKDIYVREQWIEKTIRAPAPARLLQQWVAGIEKPVPATNMMRHKAGQLTRPVILSTPSVRIF